MEEAKNTVKKEKMSIGAIQDILWDGIHDLRAGEMSAANLSAITNATGKILSTVALQLKYAQMTGREPEISMLKDQGVKQISESGPK